MKRREFLTSVTAVAAGSVLPAAPAVWSPARAQLRQETLLIVTESGPNNLDVHGVGTIVPGYEVSWNCYDRLITHDKKTLADGTDYYDRDKLIPELAEDFSVGDMSVTFKLRKDAAFHDGTPVTARDVKWSFDRAVTVGGERGDADISFELPPKDFAEMKQQAKLKIASTPISNGIQYIGMNVTKPPFDNPKVRQAVACAIPYQKILDAVMFGQAKPMFGAPHDGATSVSWPQPHSYNSDIAKAKPLLAQAGYADGFETTLSFDLSFAVVNEPLCVLLQESLAQVGIKTTINKIPGANWRNELIKKELPLIANVFSGWLDYPEYFFFWCYHGQNAVFNTMSYQNKEMDALIDGARAAAASGDRSTYDRDVKGSVDKAFADVPRIPLYQPYLNVAMQRNISGYRYWFHRRLDYRTLAKG